MFTGTPECRPIPETSTGRCTVVSNRKVYLPHLELLITASSERNYKYMMQKDLLKLQCG